MKKIVSKKAKTLSDKKRKVVKKDIKVQKLKVQPKINVKAKGKVATKIKPKVKAKIKTKTKLKQVVRVVKVKAKTKTKIGNKLNTKAKIKGKIKAKVDAKVRVKPKVKVAVKVKAKGSVKKPVAKMKSVLNVKTKGKIKPIVKIKTKVKVAVPVKSKTVKVVLKSNEQKAISKSKVQALKSKIVEKIVFGPVDVMPYKSSQDEEYMNDEQLQHFRTVLLKWKGQLMEEVDRTMHHMQDDISNYPDPVDRASQEEGFSLELRARDRDRKLLRKIEETLSRINDRDYGYCDDCGAEIGVRRLEARPTATQCIECKTIAEIREKQVGDGS